MTVACIVQARLGSTRFPNKIMQNLAGKPVLQHVLERCKLIPDVDVVVCAVPHGDAKAEAGTKMVQVPWTIQRHGTRSVFHPQTIIDRVNDAGALLYEAPASISEDDVLSRYVGAAALVAADKIVRVTSDCPLIDPEICGKVVNRLIASTPIGKDAYASNVSPRVWPKGLDCEAFTAGLLLRAHERATGPLREHVTTWMRWKTGVRCLSVSPADMGAEYAKMRWTVDYPDDLEFIRAVCATEVPMGFEKTMNAISVDPDLSMMNERRKDD